MLSRRGHASQTCGWLAWPLAPLDVASDVILSQGYAFLLGVFPILPEVCVSSCAEPCFSCQYLSNFARSVRAILRRAMPFLSVSFQLIRSVRVIMRRAMLARVILRRAMRFFCRRRRQLFSRMDFGPIGGASQRGGWPSPEREYLESPPSHRQTKELIECPRNTSIQSADVGAGCFLRYIGLKLENANLLGVNKR